ncbi:MAG: putative Fe-S cluster assembly protein SufT [Gammaproteobacteria bacterium]|nr:putative Fe-S cluster assembly protein SufT [Gammaproteobacteria bacterium]
MKIEDVTIVKRDVEGTLIPYGQSVTLIPGTEVLVTQSLGGSFTLNVNGNLVRIEGKDADAIGKEPVLLPSEKIGMDVEGVSEDLVWEQLRTCFDPEIPVNIVDLGLIYELEITEQKKGGFHIGVQMTLTAPGCGMGPVLTQDIENKLLMIPNVKKVDVVLVFDPPWNSDRMSEAAKLELDLF